MPVSSLLPIGLIAILFASPAFGAPPSIGTTSYNPLYNIAKHVQKIPELPMCCLKPLQSSEPAQEILSFEDWKAKQSSLLVHNQKASNPSPNPVGNSASSTDSQADVYPIQPAPPEDPPPPHFRVPLTDRFNYASLDCSARVHSSHATAKSTASILSSKKDRYMLSPCATPQQKFVIVELCEDIRIDTVQLANFEFFSGVFKDFNVSVARTYTTDPDGWTHAGTYRAKNIRGVQSFHPPTSLRDFYRYIRIDFVTHYGNEYYCPVSLLRVYGLTHLEHWKWDVWEAESRAKKDDAEELAARLVVAEESYSSQMEAQATAVADSSSFTESQGQNSSSGGDASNSGSNQTTELQSNGGEDLDKPLVAADVTHVPLSSLPSSTVHDPHIIHQETSHPTEISSTIVEQVVTSSTAISLTSDTISVPPTTELQGHTTPISSEESQTPQYNTVSSQSQMAPSTVSPPDTSAHPLSQSTTISSTHMTTIASTVSVGIPTVVPNPVHPVPAVTSAGESIYRTIMNRLSLLEANSTLYARYVEEQTRSVRDALRRLEEDVGRLEGLGKAQVQLVQRTVHEWEKQRRRLDREHDELLSRVNFLTDEVILEKRLGIAQLCLLLTVLVFMALTRGSRGESFMDNTNFSMSGFKRARGSSIREWGRRNLSISGDWVTKFRSRSLTPTPIDSSSVQSSMADTVKFPTTRPKALEPSLSRRTPTGAKMRSPTTARTPGSKHRPVTPTGPHSTHFRQGSTSGSARPQITRSNSQGIPASQIGPVPRSAKRWAKMAHLHELHLVTSKPANQTDADESNRQVEAGGDVFWPTTPPVFVAEGKVMDVTNPLSASREPLVSLDNVSGRRELASPWQPGGVKTSDTDVETEGWVDTDVDGSEAGQDANTR